MGVATRGTPSNGPNRVVSATLGDGKLDTAYDAAGNLTRMLVRKKAPQGGNVTLLFAYEWDEVGQLVRARRLSSSEIPNLDTLGTEALRLDVTRVSGPVDLRYTYDAAGQRIVKSSQNRRSVERTYSAEIFSSLRLNHARFENGDYERNDETETVYLVSNGGAVARVLYDEDLPRGVNGRALHILFTITDPLGSTSVVVDKDTSEVVERATYLAYGQPDSDYRPEKWKSFREDYRFTGKEDDVGVGLTYFGARYYVAPLGQWASADPLTIHALGSDLNPYAFVKGSPQRYVDTDGMNFCLTCGWDQFVGGMGPGGFTGYGVPGGMNGMYPFYVPGPLYSDENGQPHILGVPTFKKETIYEDKNGNPSLRIPLQACMAYASEGYCNWIKMWWSNDSEEDDLCAYKASYCKTVAGFLKKQWSDHFGTPEAVGEFLEGAGDKGEQAAKGLLVQLFSGGAGGAAEIVVLETGEAVVANSATAAPALLAGSTLTAAEALEQELGRKPTKKELANYENKLKQDAGEEPEGGTRSDSAGGPLRGGHSSGGRGSTRDKHEAGDSRRGRDQGGEKGDTRRPY